MSDFSQISLELPDLGGHGIATITLNRPEKLNAFTDVMVRELIAAFDITDADDAVRSVIVTGAGQAFCAGADVSGAPRRSRLTPATTKSQALARPESSRWRRAGHDPHL